MIKLHDSIETLDKNYFYIS